MANKNLGENFRLKKNHYLMMKSFNNLIFLRRFGVLLGGQFFY
jgi:hypothetical protein